MECSRFLRLSPETLYSLGFKLLFGSSYFVARLVDFCVLPLFLLSPQPAVGFEFSLETRRVFDAAPVTEDRAGPSGSIPGMFPMDRPLSTHVP